MISRKKLYAAGEPLGDSATMRRADGRYLCGGGGGSSQSNPTTTNIDKRVVVSDGVGLSGDRNTITYSNNSPDAVIAIADAGKDIIKNSGAAVVELAKFQGAQNTQAWDTTITQGAKLIDKLMTQTGEGFKLSQNVVDKFQPTANANADIGKYAMLAAAAVAAAVLLQSKS